MKRTGKVNGPIAPWKDRAKSQRRAAADERDKAYKALTLQQRLEKLDKYGHNAVKERAKLNALIENAKNEAKTPKK